MILFFLSFVAGLLTVLAPCTLSLLPIIIGGSISDTRKRNPVIITASLAAAVIIFTLVLKVSTIFINIPEQVWAVISGVIIISFGVTSLWPDWWARVSVKLGFSNKSETMLTEAAEKKSRWGDVLLGASLGPVFASCSPTYFLIIATVLPQSFGRGLIDLAAYAAGMALVLLLVAWLGQRFIRRVKWAADPNGWFKRGLGLLFLVVGILVLTGGVKKVQIYLITHGYFDISKYEIQLLQKSNVQ